MTKALFVLLGLGWLVFALSGYVVGRDVLFVNWSSVTYFFLRLDNGTLIPLVESPPAYLVGTGERVEAELVYTEEGVGLEFWRRGSPHRQSRAGRCPVLCW